jgi:Na+/alanine symporter
MRRKVDLRRLTPWKQRLVALTVVAAVVLSAWLLGGVRSIPTWVSRFVLPLLGLFYILALAYTVRARLRERRGPRRAE